MLMNFICYIFILFFHAGIMGLFQLKCKALKQYSLCHENKYQEHIKNLRYLCKYKFNFEKLHTITPLKLRTTKNSTQQH